MKKHILIILLVIGYITSTAAQTFLSPTDRFSGKKTAYVTLKDGTELQGTIKDLDRKKGLIEQVIIRKENKKKVKLKPEDIKFAYLPASGLDRFYTAIDVATDANNWVDDKIDQQLIADGYIYFVTTEVQVKKKKRTMLMQLLNPDFSGKVKIFHDPFAKSTMSVGVGSITVAGGLEKSYYIQRGDKIALRVKKKDYKKEVFKLLFGDCKGIAKQFPDVKWKDLAEHVFAYSKCE